MTIRTLLQKIDDIRDQERKVLALEKHIQSDCYILPSESKDLQQQQHILDILLNEEIGDLS